jgi:hypothetical protein
MKEFEYTLKGPTDDVGIFSPQQSVNVTTTHESEILFNTDTVDTPFYNGITMFITDESCNTLMTVNYLLNRCIEKQHFGFKHKNGNIYYGVFPCGTIGVALCSFPITNN